MYMKLFKHLHSNVEPWNLFIGIAIGVGVGLYIYSCVPLSMRQEMKFFSFGDGMHMRAGEAGGDMFFVRGGELPSHMMATHAMATISLSQGTVTTDKEFLEQMIQHHAEGVQMAQHVLTLNPKEDVKKLANDIISLQSDEIRLMKQMLADWAK